MSNTAARTRGEFLFGVLFFLAVVVGLSSTVSDLKRWFFEEDRIPVEGLVVQGKLEYVTVDDVRKTLLETPEVINFFKLNVDKIQQSVQGLPWVYQASIRKRWPALLYVYIIEQTPRARWGDDRLLSERGGIFKAPLDRLKRPLVRLSGPDEMADKVWDEYKRYERILALNGYHIAALNLTSRHSWEVQLDKGPVLILGRGDVVARLQRFIDVYPLLDEHERIAYLDLRYDTGIAVGWKPIEGTGNDQDRGKKPDSRT